MKFINKSVLAVFAALACAGQSLAAPVSFAKFVREKDQLAIYMIGDYHAGDDDYFDRLNSEIVKYLMAAALKINALIFVEQGCEEISHSHKTSDGFLANIGSFTSWNLVKRFDPRFEIYDVIENKQNIKDGCKLIVDTLEKFKTTKLVDTDLNTAFQAILQELMDDKNSSTFFSLIGDDKVFDNDAHKFKTEYNKLCKPNSSKPVYFEIFPTLIPSFLDLQMLIELDQAIAHGSKNFFLCLGNNHFITLKKHLEKFFLEKELLFQNNSKTDTLFGDLYRFYDYFSKNIQKIFAMEKPLQQNEIPIVMEWLNVGHPDYKKQPTNKYLKNLYHDLKKDLSHQDTTTLNYLCGLDVIFKNSKEDKFLIYTETPLHKDLEKCCSPYDDKQTPFKYFTRPPSKSLLMVTSGIITETVRLWKWIKTKFA